MRWRWLGSVVASFVLCAYLGVWLCGLLYAPAAEKGDPLMEPPVLSARSVMEEALPPAVVPLPATDLLEPIGFELSAAEVDPGEYLVMSVHGAPADAEFVIENPFGASPHFFEVDGRLAALLPVKYTYAPGEYLLRASGGGFEEEFTIRVREKQFPTQNLVADKSVVDSTVNNDAANVEYNQKVQAIKNRAATAPLWDGAFASPLAVDYRVTTEYGLIRNTNGGIDMACPRGSVVSAANSGTVLFAEYIALTGNTVMIEHGLGLKTLYYHMDSLAVKTGDTVLKGQPIGAVGSTGFSTGPHLHFAASVYETYVNPWTLFEEAPAV